MTALLSIAVGISQLSGAARARHVADWTAAALAAEHNEYRRVVLERLKVEAQMQLVAARSVPGWRSVEAFACFLLAAAMALLPFLINWTTGPLSVGVTIAVVLFLMIRGFRRVARTYVQRHRIAQRFAAGDSVQVPASIKQEAVDNAAVRDLGTSWAMLTGVLSQGAVLVYFQTQPSSIPGLDALGWGLLALLASTGALLAGLTYVHMRRVSRLGAEELDRRYPPPSESSQGIDEPEEAIGGE